MRYIFLVLLLSGCGDFISSQNKGNDYVIVEKDKCLKAGMDYVIGDGQTVACIHPKKEYEK